MSALTVTHETGDRFAIAMGEHCIAVGQPQSVGGNDSAPTPTQLFVASLGACVAFFGRRFLARHGLAEGLQVTADYTLSVDRPARVEAIELSVVTDAILPAERRDAFQRVLEHCTVHNSLHQPPVVDIQTNMQRAA